METIKEKQEREKYIQKAREVEKQFNIPANMLVGLLKTESNFNPKAVSSVGARGVAQFMPQTAKEYGIDPFEPMQSIEAAGKYLSQNYKKLGNWDDTLRSYNMGLGGVQKWKAGKRTLPKETQEYVGKVYKNMGIPYSESTTTVTDFDIPNISGNFESVPDVYKEPEKEENKAVQELQQKSAEKSFIEEYLALQQTPQQQVIEEEQVQPLPQTDIMTTFNQVSQFIDEPIAQEGGQFDMWGNPITVKIKEGNNPRSYYNARTNEMILGDDYKKLTPEEQKKVIAHENRHGWQFDNDRTNFMITHYPDYAFNEKLLKKPNIVNTDDVWNSYHNRKNTEISQDLRNLKINHPELQFVGNDALYERILDNKQYDNPYSMEGEAEYYHNTGKRSFQEGGVIKDNTKVVNKNRPELNEVEDGKEFTIEYIQSPKYRERLIKQGYKNVDEEIKNRLQNVRDASFIYQNGNPSLLQQLKSKVKNEPYSTTGSRYDAETNKVIIDKKDTKVTDVNYIKTHELGHTQVDRDKNSGLNSNDIIQLFNRQKTYKTNETFRKNTKALEDKIGFKYVPHDLRPSENKSDLDAFRHFLKDEKIYDAGKEDFTKKHLETIKNKESFIKDRLLKNYSEEDLIWLMNNIAASNKKTEQQVYAQEGGKPIQDNMGQYKFPGEVTQISSPNITMKNIPYDIFAVADTGETKMMKPNQDYYFQGAKSVTEYPQLTEKEKAFLKAIQQYKNQ